MPAGIKTKREKFIILWPTTLFYLLFVTLIDVITFFKRELMLLALLHLCIFSFLFFFNIFLQFAWFYAFSRNFMRFCIILHVFALFYCVYALFYAFTRYFTRLRVILHVFVILRFSRYFTFFVKILRFLSLTFTRAYSLKSFKLVLPRARICWWNMAEDAQSRRHL